MQSCAFFWGKINMIGAYIGGSDLAIDLVKGGWWFKNLTGTLHIGGIACTLSVDREVKMEIPVHPA
jgi:hypothetical protein